MTQTLSARLLAAFLGAVMLSGCAALQKGPLGNLAVPQPAKPVEISQYLGRWYEIGRYEAVFQKDCEGVTADYSLAKPGQIAVVNQCRKGALDGIATTANGKAKIVEGSNNAKLRVSFFGPFYGDYWVLDRAEDYSWSIVGEPSGQYLWLLHRKPQPGVAIITQMRTRATELGYDLSLLRMTQQPAGN
jgi:apolipoprotein D and lipocalin family protein